MKLSPASALVRAEMRVLRRPGRRLDEAALEKAAEWGLDHLVEHVATNRLRGKYLFPDGAEVWALEHLGDLVAIYHLKQQIRRTFR